MSLDVSTIASYIENNDTPLVGQIQVSPEMTSAMVTLVTAVKGSTNLHVLETDCIFQSGGGCARTAAGTTVRTDITMVAGRIAIAEDLCFDDLAGKWDQTMLKQGLLTGIQTMPEEFAKIYFDEKMAKMKQAIEIADWQGNTASGAANYNKYTGWIAHIDGGSPVDGNTDNQTTLTLSNVVAAFRNMFLAIPENLKMRSDLVLFCSPAVFQMYQQAVLAANLFHFTGGDQEYTIIGTNVKIKPTYGLTGGTLNTYPRMFLTYPSNLVVGIDLASDENFTSRIDPVTNKKLLVDAQFTRGTQIYFTEDVVEFTIHGS